MKNLLSLIMVTITLCFGQGKPDSILTYMYSDSDWVLMQKIISTYPDEFTKIDVNYTSMQGTWISSSKQVTKVNEHGDDIMLIAIIGDVYFDTTYIINTYEDGK